MKVVMNNPWLGHQHFARPLRRQQFIGAGHDSDGRLQAQPDRKSEYHECGDGKSASALAIDTLTGTLERWRADHFKIHERSTPCWKTSAQLLPNYLNCHPRVPPIALSDTHFFGVYSNTYDPQMSLLPTNAFGALKKLNGLNAKVDRFSGIFH
jgi:hypothetical protein